MKSIQELKQELINGKSLGDFTKEEIELLKYGDNDDDEIVESGDYNDVQISDMKKRKAKGEKLTSTESKVLTGDRIDKAQEQLMRFVHGRNDIFHKHYDFKEDGVSFDISIREPNIGEQGRILAMQGNYLLGLGNYVNNYWNDIYYTLALIRTCGEQVPKELANDDKIYSPAYKWLEQICSDFSEWERRFHS